jgi:hypothetical protein
VEVDERRIIDWRGDSSRLSPNEYWATPHTNVPFVGAYLCSYRIQRLELKTISGSGRPLRPAAAPEKPAEANPPADADNSASPP